MQLAWGVDIDPVIAMVSIAFGRHCISLLNVSFFFFFFRVLPLLVLPLSLKLLSRLIALLLYYRFCLSFMLILIYLHVFFHSKTIVKIFNLYLY